MPTLFNHFRLTGLNVFKGNLRGINKQNSYDFFKFKAFLILFFNFLDYAHTLNLVSEVNLISAFNTSSCKRDISRLGAERRRKHCKTCEAVSETSGGVPLQEQSHAA